MSSGSLTWSESQTWQIEETLPQDLQLAVGKTCEIAGRVVGEAREVRAGELVR
jgi:hypothetical protein